MKIFQLTFEWMMNLRWRHKRFRLKWTFTTKQSGWRIIVYSISTYCLWSIIYFAKLNFYKFKHNWIKARRRIYNKTNFQKAKQNKTGWAAIYSAGLIKGMLFFKTRCVKRERERQILLFPHAPSIEFIGSQWNQKHKLFIRGNEPLVWNDWFKCIGILKLPGKNMYF